MLCVLAAHLRHQARTGRRARLRRQRVPRLMWPAAETNDISTHKTRVGDIRRIVDHLSSKGVSLAEEPACTVNDGDALDHVGLVPGPRHKSLRVRVLDRQRRRQLPIQGFLGCGVIAHLGHENYRRLLKDVITWYWILKERIVRLTPTQHLCDPKTRPSHASLPAGTIWCRHVRKTREFCW